MLNIVFPIDPEVHQFILQAVNIADAPPSYFFKFQFNQRGGRMQILHLATENHLCGSARRIAKKKIQVLLVFPVPLDKGLVSLVFQNFKQLPEYNCTRHGLSTLYSHFLGIPFKVMRTRPPFIDNELSISEEPDDAQTEITSVSGTSSYN